MSRAGAGKFDRWQALLDYGALFRPWLAGEEMAGEEARPVSPQALARLRGLTERYGTGTSLAWALQQRPLEAPVRSYAQLALLYGRAKAERQLQGVEALVAAMSRHGIAPLLLKGAAAQVGGLHPDPGFRLMADLDILIAPAEFAASVEAAGDAGFLVVPESAEENSHALQLFSEEHGLLLEIHHQLARLYERDNFPAADVLAAAREVEFRGGRLLLPDWAHHAALTILHAVAWDRSRYMALVPIKALLDLAALKASAADVDWAKVQALMIAAGERSSLVHAEVLFRALFGTALTGLPVSAARRRAVERYYALGAAYPWLHNIGLFHTDVRKRLLRARKKPRRLLKLLTPSFYGRVAADSRKAFRPDAPLS